MSSAKIKPEEIFQEITEENDGPSDENWKTVRTLYHGGVESQLFEALEIDGYAALSDFPDADEGVIGEMNSHIALHTDVPFRLEMSPDSQPFHKRELYMKRLR